MPNPLNSKEYEGRVYGRLTIKSLYRTRQSRKGSLANCICSCGKLGTYTMSSLRKGDRKSCGCSKIALDRKPHVKKEKRTLSEQALIGLYTRLRANNKKHKNSKIISLSIFTQLVTADCFYCGKEPSNKFKTKSMVRHYKYNGLDRVDSNKGYEENNVVPCCAKCNHMKSDMQQSEFFEHVLRIANMPNTWDRKAK